MHRLFVGNYLMASVLLSLSPQTTLGDIDTIGPNGINSAGLRFNQQLLTGNDVAIGQLEGGRPGLPGFDSASCVHTSVVPAAVYFRTGAPLIEICDTHAQRVAGVMISSHSSLTGVAQSAQLYATSVGPGSSGTFDDWALTLQFISQGKLAVNHSYGFETADPINGNSQVTLALDWSAKKHNVLHVVSGYQGNNNPIPKDNFNGIVVGASTKVGDVWRRVASYNDYSQDPLGDRTAISLLGERT